MYQVEDQMRARRSGDRYRLTFVCIKGVLSSIKKRIR